MSKRLANDGDSSAQLPIKKNQFEPIPTLEEIDMKVLQFKNRTLTQVLEQRHRMEAELREKIEQLERRQTQDDAILSVVNRSWNQLNEDIRDLMQRFDPETADESENKNEGEATANFRKRLSTCDKEEELEIKQTNRAQVSKVVQAFDRLFQRNKIITLALKEKFKGEEGQNIDKVVQNEINEIHIEKKNLQATNLELHEKYRTLSLKMSELQETIAGKDTLASNLQNQVDDLQSELNKVRARNDKLEQHLGEAIEKLKAFQQICGSDDKASNKSNTLSSSVSLLEIEDLQRELKETREMANNKLQKLDKLHQQYRDSLKEVEKLELDSFYKKVDLLPIKSEKRKRTPAKREGGTLSRNRPGSKHDSIEQITECLTNTVHTLISCRTIRIGSYKCISPEEVIISSKGLRLKVPFLEDNKKLVTIDVKFKHIVRLLAHFGKSMLILFFYTTTATGNMIRDVLGMQDPKGPYFDPASKYHYNKRITIFPEELNEESKTILKALYVEKLEVLNAKEANDILVRATPPDIEYICQHL